MITPHTRLAAACRRFQFELMRKRKRCDNVSVLYDVAGFQHEISIRSTKV